MKESTQGAGAEGARPPCVEAARSAASFMDERVAVAVAVAKAVAAAVTEAVAEADQSIHDQSIHDPPTPTLWTLGPHGPMNLNRTLWALGPYGPMKVNRTLWGPWLTWSDPPPMYL